MRHDWIFDVLTDLQSYALRHDLPALAAQADLALRVARAEIAAASGAEDGCHESNADAPDPAKGRLRRD
ncbi:hypothetical protein [Szabonella alba]|uniref:Uncharacterized protein n=1 Tax=Szabonella alba TaxID=2804194 RepID=A0A8K0VAG2_9RHOB|nr:hypothetical protein [Szabonella alba]MBL4916214.1 hypothetical protein [Szabonella alba]